MPDCPVCGEPRRASNLRRHLNSRHPGVLIQTVPERIKAFSKLLARNASDQELADFLGLDLACERQPVDLMKSRDLAEQVLEAMMTGGTVDVSSIRGALENIRELTAVVPAAAVAMQAYDAFLRDSDAEIVGVDAGVSYDKFVESMIVLRHAFPGIDAPELDDYEKTLRERGELQLVGGTA